MGCIQYMSAFLSVFVIIVWFLLNICTDADGQQKLQTVVVAHSEQYFLWNAGSYWNYYWYLPLISVSLKLTAGFH